jgi:hypothetical protein
MAWFKIELTDESTLNTIESVVEFDCEPEEVDEILNGAIPPDMLNTIFDNVSVHVVGVE